MSNTETGKKVFGVETAFLQLLTLPVGVVVLFVVSLFVVIVPRISAISDMRKKATETDNMTKSVQEKIKYLSGINPVDLKQNTNRLNSAIFAEKNSYFLIDIIRGIADQYDFQIQDFSLSPGEVKQEDKTAVKKAVDAVTKIPVDMVLVGPRAKYLDFIEAMEKSLPILSMDRFQLVTEQDTIKLDVMLVSYYIPSKGAGDLSKLTLADLTLTKEESDLIKKLADFKKAPTSSVGIGATNSQGFIKYTRPNPFAL